MRLPNKKDLLRILAASIISISGTFMSGCSFFKSNDIIKDTKEIMDIQHKLFKEYQGKDLVVKEKYPEREVEPHWILNEDNTYTLYYPVAYGDMASIQKVLTDQVKGATINTESNQFIITTKDAAQRSNLEELLYKTDRIPRHVELEIEIDGQLAGITKDYSSELNFRAESQGETSVIGSGLADLPNSAPRVLARASMINRWGLELKNEDFAFKAFIDFLEGHEYVKRLYQTRVLVADRQKIKLGEEEKLLIPAYVLSGITPVQTFNLVDVISSTEINPVIHDGLIELSFQAIIGGSKRPEIRQRIMVPVKNVAEINKTYLKVGQPCSVAGNATDLEIGTIRKDPFWPWPSGQDYEHRVTKLWYTVTPSKVIIYDPNSLVRPEYPIYRGMYDPNSLVKPAPEVTDPNSKDKPNAKLYDKYTGIDYKILKYLIKEAA